MRPISGALFLALTSACLSNESEPVRVARGATPAVSLEEIFLEPSIAGVAPRVQAVSADGTWLLFRWDPTRPGTGDPPRPSLRLMEIRRPADTDHRGLPLDSLLPVAED